MEKGKYRILRPWFGVKKHDVIELREPLNPAIKDQVEKVDDDVELTVHPAQTNEQQPKRRGRPPKSQLVTNPADTGGDNDKDEDDEDSEDDKTE